MTVKLKMLGWSRIKAIRARDQGWRLDLTLTKRILICRSSHVPSNLPRFSSRKEAEAFVKTKAGEGDSLCLEALSIIAKHRLLS